MRRDPLRIIAGSRGSQSSAKARGITEDQVINDVLLHAQPTKKFVQIDAVAALATFLAGDGAASITGAIMPIDRGWTAH